MVQYLKPSFDSRKINIETHRERKGDRVCQLNLSTTTERNIQIKRKRS